MLLQRLNTPMPIRRESRTGFITRFRAAVDWLNAHRSELLTQDCTNQLLREREAAHVIELPDGYHALEERPRRPWSLLP